MGHTTPRAGGRRPRRSVRVRGGGGLEGPAERRDLLGEAGWDPTYGARPLKRAIQRLLENPLALRLLEGEFAEGDVARVDVKDGELGFEKATAAQPAAA